MELRQLSDAEALEVTGGEALTLTAMMAVLVIGIVAIVCYKLFMGRSGKTTLPGGFMFQWE
jgi:hypothetical protein